jgi:hypothetical protein
LGANKIYPLINDFRNWPKWSPWAQMDKEMKTSFAGPEVGVGSSYSWAGNQQVGEGKMTIMENSPNAFVKIKLEFFKPFAAQNFAEFTLIPEAGGVKVSWSMAGRLGFTEKMAHIIMNMDKMVGGEFEKGLNQIKALAEAR